MRRTRFARALAVAGVTCFATLVPHRLHAQGRSSAPLWGSLQPGPHRVGFRIIYRLDRSRAWDTADSATDPGRPVRVSMWYPARPSSGTEMRRRDYTRLPPATAPFARLNALLETRENQSVRGMFAGAESHVPRFDSLRVVARRNADAAAGRFPLVMYSEGWNSSIQHDNAVLAEYLASHGFVVASVPQVGPTPGEFQLRLNLEHLEIQMRDIEYAMGVVMERPFVDVRRVALMGWSMGGVVSLLIAGRNPNVDAVIGLDASFRARDWTALTMSSPYFAMRRLTVPVLALQTGNEKHVGGQSDAVVDSLHFTPRYLARIPHVTHGDFSDFAMIAPLFPVQIVDRTAEQAARGHEAIARAVLAFLTHTVKGRVGPVQDSVRAASGIDIDYRQAAAVPAERKP